MLECIIKTKFPKNRTDKINDQNCRYPTWKAALTNPIPFLHKLNKKEKGQRTNNNTILLENLE